VVGDAGLAVDPHDVNALRTAMDLVLGNERLAASMRVRSLARAAEFSWDAAADKLIALFEDTRRKRCAA
jgi:glycosyltransferase involved in cell wall biosynthesis